MNPPPNQPEPSYPRRMTWLDEWHDFWAFVRRPRLSRRCRQVTPRTAWVLDWMPGISFLRLLGWAAILWGINIFLFGPIVIGISKQAGATHAVDPANLPWLLALVWAPLVEEMLFRYGLRRPGIALWLVPLMVLALWLKPGVGQSLIFALVILAIYRVTSANPMPGVRARQWLRLYRRWFWLIFHVSVLTFASLHLFNFTFTSAQWWMLPALVLPQWFTGLVLGWMRVMRGIGAAILLHALFNFGPLMAAWLAMRWLQSAGLA
ncbi:CPBP family intramembrane metalloprotease [Orrella daihaiensis]|uniref:CPBP family intramembrane metalloprotease n=2 Tax=Orrella daihaiensis TaxID=2782176 RepID=A0ABY4AKS4_9BURK|nr:CPBP family intramembrane metalloprotease [Orrella daihaiensis]